MRRTTLTDKRALLLIAILACSIFAPTTAHAADCSTTVSTFIGDGTNGTSGVAYKVYTISQTGTCTWVVPASVTNADVLVVGGGGGGAGAYSGYSYGGGGGGGGGAFRADAYPLTPGASMAITVGAGGSGGGVSASSSTNQGSPGSTTIFDQISGGGGGGGGYAVGSTNNNGRAGTAGGGGGGSSNYWYAYDGGAGGTGSSVTVGAKTYTGVSGGTGGVYVAGQSATGDGGAGGGRSNATIGATPAPGSGFSTYISGSNITYGTGGKAQGTGGWTAGAAQTGIGFGGNGGTNLTGGSAGANGIVIIRESQSGILAVNSFALAGNVTNSNYRTGINITINVNVAAKVTFISNGKRIGRCVKLATTGTSPNITATCNWKPSNRGRVILTASATPISGGNAVNAGPITVSVANRSGNR